MMEDGNGRINVVVVGELCGVYAGLLVEMCLCVCVCAILCGGYAGAFYRQCRAEFLRGRFT